MSIISDVVYTGNITAPNLGGTTVASITAAITTDGSDALNVARTAQLKSGDYSATPFLTLAGALAAIPRHLNYDVNITIGAGSFAGGTISGFAGGGYASGRATGLVLNGHYALATLTTGLNTGNAGVGTTTTSIVKPTGSADWTASNLLGKLVRFPTLGTAAHPVIREVVAHSVSNITVEAVTGLTDATPFDIVLPDTLLTSAITAAFNTAPLMIRGMLLSATAVNALLSVGNSGDVVLDGCVISGTYSGDSVYSTKDSSFSMTNCVLSNGNSVLVEKNAKAASVSNIYATGAGEIKFTDCLFTDFKVTSTGALGVVVRAKSIKTMKAEGVANGGASHGFYFEGVDVLDCVGNALTGTGNASYGIQIEKAGRYNLVGCTVTGTGGDVLFMNTGVTWVNLTSGSFGMAEEHAASAFASGSYVKALKYGSYLFFGDVDFSGRSLEYGYHNFASNIANPVVFSGSEVYNMHSSQARTILEVTCNSALAKVVLPQGAVGVGCFAVIINIGSQAIGVEAPAGGVLTGATTVPAGSVKIFFSQNGNGGLDWIEFVP